MTLFKMVLGTFVAIALLAACSDRPSPRGSAYQGTSWAGDSRTHDAPYYLGADPAFRRGHRSGP